MIVYDLTCDHGHRFEGWFGSSDDYADQKAKGLLACPACGSAEVAKAPFITVLLFIAFAYFTLFIGEIVNLLFIASSMTCGSPS